MKSEKNNLSDIILKLNPIFIVLTCIILLSNCKKKCEKENFYTFNEPLIDEIKDISISQSKINLISNQNKFIEILDSLNYYSNFEGISIDFNKNSVIFFQAKVETKKNSYINGYNFVLIENDANYEFIIEVCNKKVIRNKKARNPFETMCIITEKLKNKPIFINIKDEN